MEKPRIVRRQRQYPSVVRVGEPRTEVQKRLLDQQLIEKLEDLIDDSLRFVAEEMARIGLPPAQAPELQSRISYGLLSEWVYRLMSIDDVAQLALYGEQRDRRLLGEFFERRFERPLPEFGSR